MSAAPLHVTSMPDVSMDWDPSSVSASLDFMGMVSTASNRKVGEITIIVMHDRDKHCNMTLIYSKNTEIYVLGL